MFDKTVEKRLGKSWFNWKCKSDGFSIGSIALDIEVNTVVKQSRDDARDSPNQIPNCWSHSQNLGYSISMYQDPGLAILFFPENFREFQMFQPPKRFDQSRRRRIAGLTICFRMRCTVRGSPPARRGSCASDRPRLGFQFGMWFGFPFYPYSSYDHRL